MGVDGSALEQVLGLLGPDGDGRAPVGLDDLATACGTVLAVDDVAIQVRRPGGATIAVGASSSLARRGEDEELAWGQGPSWTVVDDGGVVLAADLEADKRWPMTAEALVDTGIRAVRSFPIQFGASRVGSLTDYRPDPVPIVAGEVAWGIQVSRAAMTVLVTLDPSGEIDRSTLRSVEWVAVTGDADWSVVHQATGMVAIQLGCSLDEATASLMARAFALACPIVDLARNVVARQVRFAQ